MNGQQQGGRNIIVTCKQNRHQHFPAGQNSCSQRKRPNAPQIYVMKMKKPPKVKAGNSPLPVRCAGLQKRRRVQQQEAMLGQHPVADSRQTANNTR